jgi:basic membrane lipoprotein Med (substrate-binding protein (PBP1-ABC) superfamily)/DNA-binding SARP family transcriptional activator
VLELGGAKQRAVLAALLLRAGEVVSVERLIDEVWGDSPPSSAARSLESYVSRLRHLLASHGVSFDRRGGGYRIDLGEAVLDSRLFEALVDAASERAAVGDHERAVELASEALGLWRGPVLSGLRLHYEGRADAERLEEHRVHALKIRADAELAQGHHSQLVAQLRRLVEENPYREQFVAQLMVALYRSGRQAEALEAYERTRRTLMDNLGIQAGPDLQRLSAQIVRQEPHLAALRPIADGPGARAARRPGIWVAIFSAALVAVGVAVALGLVADSGGGPNAAPSTRVALVVPRAPIAGREDTFVWPFVYGLLRSAQEYGLDTKTFVVDDVNPSRASLDRLRRTLRTRDFRLVLWAGFGYTHDPELVALVQHLSATRFIYIDASLRGTPLQGEPNATALRFADNSSGYLAGYLSGLAGARRSPLWHGDPVVSIVGGISIPPVSGLVEGFTRGARAARPGIAVQVAYAGTFSDQSVCERIANRQIDQGARVVFAAAGTCGLGALSAAGLRGVWGVGADTDRSYLGSHILVSTVKRYDRAVQLAIRWFFQGSLPSGDVLLGLDDDAVGITGISPEVSSADRRALARLAASLRKREAAMPGP